MDLQGNRLRVEELIQKFENFENFQIKKNVDKSKQGKIAIDNDISGDSQWLEETAIGLSDEENDNIGEDGLSHDNEFNSLNRPSKMKLHSCRNMNITKLDTENNDSNHSSTTSSSSSTSDKNQNQFDEVVKITNNVNDDFKWLQEIEKGFSDDESDNSENNISNVENELTDYNEFNSITSFTRPVLRSKTEVNSKRKIYTNVRKYYSENNYTDFGLSQSRCSTSSSGSETLSSGRDILTPIIDEFISTEKNFVQNVRFGLENYSKLFEEENLIELPKSLIGKQYVLFRNIEDILDFHENEFLPMLLEEMNDYTKLFEKIAEFVDKNSFYSHLLYNMNKKAATKLCQENREFFKEVEIKIGDKLGIISFIMQPIIRLTKYPLLMREIMKKCFKNFEDKLVLQSCCVAEKKLSDLLSFINESEQVNDIEECDDINISHQGRFKKVDIFHVYNNNIERGYRGKCFLFEKSMIYAEIRDNSLIYRGYYPFDNLGINVKDQQFTIYFDKPGFQECVFGAEKSKIDLWTKLIRDNLKEFFLTKRKSMLNA